MKKFLTILLLCPISVLAQSQADYERTFSRFVSMYNRNATDSICTVLFNKNLLSDEGCFWDKVNKDSNRLEEYGRIQSFKYLGKDKTDPEQVCVYKVKLAKAGIKAVSFTLYSNASPAGLITGPYFIGTFRLFTSSDEIERMMKTTK